ncbi:MAG: DUF3109 family protein [Bacteroidetes bacterium]|nr:MAG: DUF3109 family protein [Bacteroidota bacterium]
MIAIDDKLVSDELVEAQFVCDLVKCKGGCCVDGDAGAPLGADELAMLDAAAPVVRQLLPPQHQAELDRQGRYVPTNEFGMVTPTINGGVCVYAIIETNGVVKCGIERAYNAGMLANTAAAGWKKPISCHLFPVRIANSADGDMTYVNYEPRPTLCKPACKLGKKLKVPVYRFLKEPLVRKFGPEFYEALDAVATDYLAVKEAHP